MKNVFLYQLTKQLKIFLTVFLLVLTIGIMFGLFFLFHTTSFSSSKTTERLSVNSENIEEDFGINEAPVRSTGELLTTTHNHILGFSFIFFFVGGIFYFNSIIKGFWKIFLMTEPMISTVVSFGSMWLVRYYSDNYIYLTILSAVVMYISFFIMTLISIYELTLKKPS